MSFLQKKLSSTSLKERILFCSLTFLVLFFGMTIISYYFLPEGFLKNKNPLHDWETSRNSFILTLQIFINGIVLVTWSFSMGSDAVPLFSRIIRTFDLLHRAGLWEMYGQLLITCSIANISIILTSGKTTITKKFRDVRLSRVEKLTFSVGLLLMLTGAVIESISINTL